MFGDVDDEFYGLVGRIALLATLLENRLHVLYGGLTAAPEAELAGKSGTKIITECERHIDRFADDRRGEAAIFLNAAKMALNQRHAVVHSLWQFADDGRQRAWRTVRKSHQERVGYPVVWTTVQLPDLVKELVGLINRCYQLEPWIRSPLAP